MIWNVRVSPMSAILWGGLPVISLPRNRTRPEDGFTKPVMQLTVVVFPDPFGPMMPRISPSPTSKLTRLSAMMPPKVLVISWICRIGPPSYFFPPFDLMIFPLAVNHQPLAAKDNEGQQD